MSLSTNGVRSKEKEEESRSALDTAINSILLLAIERACRMNPTEKLDPSAVVAQLSATDEDRSIEEQVQDPYPCMYPATGFTGTEDNFKRSSIHLGALWLPIYTSDKGFLCDAPSQPDQLRHVYVVKNPLGQSLGYFLSKNAPDGVDNGFVIKDAASLYESLTKGSSGKKHRSVFWKIITEKHSALLAQADADATTAPLEAGMPSAPPTRTQFVLAMKSIIRCEIHEAYSSLPPENLNIRNISYYVAANIHRLRDSSSELFYNVDQKDLEEMREFIGVDIGAAQKLNHILCISIVEKPENPDALFYKVVKIDPSVFPRPIFLNSILKMQSLNAMIVAVVEEYLDSVNLAATMENLLCSESETDKPPVIFRKITKPGPHKSQKEVPTQEAEGFHTTLSTIKNY